MSKRESWVGRRIKVGPKGEKRWGIVVAHEVHREPIEVTYGGLFGGEPDRYRKFVSGQATERIIVDLEPEQ
jgi:hypothetical protein